MKYLTILFAGLATAFVSGCCSTEKAADQQGYSSSLVETDNDLKILAALDSGDASKARKAAVLPVFMDLDYLQFCTTRNIVSPTPEQKLESVKLARKTLDYMLKHRDDWDARLPSVQAGLRGLSKILTTPEDVLKLKELSDYLAIKQTLNNDAPRK
jgi:hypothetical protein